ncbi:uncharacterized protein BDR25DRAFT_382506 [Lindgomyces ingoldianus]|uniref:Uncharacterized protein n=1 Tax=Lindgomyces ingoldianus TaxID=673940 RepID=A0ACB6RAJ9_9PLEO|nr:uncharacterized protein BDR25DRAFT_382506 [Lindgomyces ingoldianus]KAF2475491.1 hypothetical protein BDR25DRAFT_382506 [Lindgomyces ingoldianus]
MQLFQPKETVNLYLAEAASPGFGQPPATPSQPPSYSAKRVFGFPLWALLLVAFIVLAVILWGVLGGILGSKSQSKTSEPQTVTAPGPTGAVTVTCSAIRQYRCCNFFHVESSTLKVKNFGDNDWKSLGDVTPALGPKEASAITAVSWIDNGGDENLGTVIASTDISEISSVAAVHRGSSSVSSNNQLRVYYESTKGGVTEVIYSSALSISVKNTSTTDPYAAFSTSGYYKSTSDLTFSTRSNVIPSDKHPVKITSDGESTFTTWNSVKEWIDGDDAGGAIGGIGWMDETSTEQARFYYSVSGNVQEMGLSGAT